MIRPFLLSVCLLVAAWPGTGATLASPPNAFEVQAILSPSSDVEVGVPVTGVLSSVHVEIGDRVELGQLLGELDSDVERASADLERARAEQTADLESAQENLAHVRRQWDRQVKVHEQGIVSDEVLQESASALRLAEIRLARVEEDQKQARLELALAEARLERRMIRAPFAGWVTERRLEPGELASPGSQAVLVRLVQLDPLVIDVPTPLPLRDSLEVGEEIAVHADHPGARWRKAKVRAISPHVDPASETFHVRLELRNPDGLLPSGLGCKVRFEL